MCRVLVQQCGFVSEAPGGDRVGERSVGGHLNRTCPAPPHFCSRRVRLLRFALRCGILAVAVLSLGAGEAAQWQPMPGGRWMELRVPEAGKTGFTLLSSAETGLVFTNTLDEWSGAANRVLYNGSGLAAGDFDGDGWPDLFCCNLRGTNALFRNLGQWHFENVTAQAGLTTPLPQTRGAVFADLNADGHLDLLLSVTGRGVLCFLNDGHGRFADATTTSGIPGLPGSTTLALADVDGNGTLDLYIADYRSDDIRDRGQVRITMVNGHPIMAGTETNRFIFLNRRLEECGQPDQLLLNDGKGRFHQVSWTDGTFLDESGQPLTEPPRDWGLTATFRDVNDDLAPDLYVCNDYWTPDRFWINDGRGHFRAIERVALRHTSASSMSVDFADIDRDGCLDFFVVDMLSRHPDLRKRQMLAQTPFATPVGVIGDRPQLVQNTLFLNQRDGTYAEISHFAGLPASDWSWAPFFLDVDLDGYEDLLIGAGHFRDVQDYDAEAQVRARQHAWVGFASETDRRKAFTRELMEHYHLYPLLRMPIGGFHNLRNCQFAEVTDDWGLNHLGVHQALVTADFDRDGDLDLAVNNLNDPAALFRNDTSAGRVAVRLKGRPPNTQGIGAKVTLLGGAVPDQSTEVIAGGHYLSGADTQLAFATGAATGGMALEVRWRSGKHSLVRDVGSNRLYEIDESGSEPAPPKTSPQPSPVFEDVSDRIAHRHPETVFNDFDRQPLLPFKLSQLGPGVAWFDLNGDGHEDLVVGAGRGGLPGVFLGDGQGQFAAAAGDSRLAVRDDLAGLVGWSDVADARTVLAGVTGYEVKDAATVLALKVGQDHAWTSAPLPGLKLQTAGALALGDMNGDGRMVLFVAGGVVPGQYPVGAPSHLYRYDGRQWAPDTRNSGVLDNLGIVNGAVWSDLDGDGLPELVLACEWGPVRVFRNQRGALFEVTDELGLKPYVGWWHGVTAGDLNNDGRLDLIASNWGLNSPYRASARQPLTFVYGQLFEPGGTGVIETEYVGETLEPRRQFMALANAMPFLVERFTSHKAFSEASLEQVLGDRLPLSRRVTATTLASTVFLNTGNGFRAVELPREAQFAPAFGVNVADLDGDGNEDVFLSQNFFATQPETPRLDAGSGLWLRGDGTGTFSAVPRGRSGIKVPGEQRGAALGDFDEDGRPDLVVTQNGAPTRLYRNVGAVPGLRVRLAGSGGNPEAVGAVLRLVFTDGSGPLREIHAGAGYWSQDSFTQVLATPSPPKALWVRWPGGRVTTTPVPAQAREISVNHEGQLTSSR